MQFRTIKPNTTPILACLHENYYSNVTQNIDSQQAKIQNIRPFFATIGKTPRGDAIKNEVLRSSSVQIPFATQ